MGESMSKVINGESYKHIWSSSDHHTTHPTTPTEHILQNFEVERLKVYNTVDMVLLNGDIFHYVTEASDPDYIAVQRWASNLTYECDRDKKVVRILEGTSSHDWGQSELFENVKPKDSKYIKYINKMCVEYIEEMGLYFLYVPDNFGMKPKTEIYEEAKQLISAEGLTQVDIIALHGAMDFQLPEVGNDPKIVYNNDDWSELAKLFIVTGHVHKPSKKNKTYSSGSFDRLKFGESHPKGSYNFYIKDDTFIAKFQENKNAMIYDTIDVNKNMDSKEIMHDLDLYLNSYPKAGSYIRIKGGRGEIVEPIIKLYQKLFPQYTFKSKNVESDKTESSNELYHLEQIKGVRITSENLNENLFKFMKNKMKLPKNIDYDYLTELLKEVDND